VNQPNDRYRKRFAITGVAGFIGSHLLETILLNGGTIVGLDNLSTGFQSNLDDVRGRVGEAWHNFTFVEGDIRSKSDCDRALEGCDVVLHQAGLNSVPRSVNDPESVVDANVMGMTSLLNSALSQNVGRFVYASSSSVYGNVTTDQRVENVVGDALSPYAASKQACESLACAFAYSKQLSSIGLRYFNVFGPRQNPNGPYSAVIPRWIAQLLQREAPTIFGDGTQSRDFTYVDNIVEANIAASAIALEPRTALRVNVGNGNSTSLLELVSLVQRLVAKSANDNTLAEIKPLFATAREGDVKSAYASVEKLRETLDFKTVRELEDGLRQTVDWFVQAHA
jgi:nucleoside-diphosphate-sugar epimerase